MGDLLYRLTEWISPSLAQWIKTHPFLFLILAIVGSLVLLSILARVDPEGTRKMEEQARRINEWLGGRKK